jgi:hypothetical protein
MPIEGIAAASCKASGQTRSVRLNDFRMPLPFFLAQRSGLQVWGVSARPSGLSSSLCKSRSLSSIGYSSSVPRILCSWIFRATLTAFGDVVAHSWQNRRWVAKSTIREVTRARQVGQTVRGTEGME